MECLGWPGLDGMFFWLYSWVTSWPWGTIATLIIAFITYRTVQEMKINREHSIQPFLVILAPQTNLLFRWLPLDCLAPIVEEFPFKKDHGGNPVFRLKNIGNGVARNIKISWKIEDEGLTQLLNKSDLLKKYTARIGSDPFRDCPGVL